MDVGESSKSKTLCSHRCILDDSCEGFFVEGIDDAKLIFCHFRPHWTELQGPLVLWCPASTTTRRKTGSQIISMLNVGQHPSKSPRLNYISVSQRIMLHQARARPCLCPCYLFIRDCLDNNYHHLHHYNDHRRPWWWQSWRGRGCCKYRECSILLVWLVVR